jgi:hypothetical protein
MAVGALGGRGGDSAAFFFDMFYTQKRREILN